MRESACKSHKGTDIFKFFFSAALSDTRGTFFAFSPVALFLPPVRWSYGLTPDQGNISLRARERAFGLLIAHKIFATDLSCSSFFFPLKVPGDELAHIGQ